MTFIYLFAIFFSTGAHADGPALNPYGTILRGDGVEIQMAYVNRKHDRDLRDMVARFKGAKVFEDGADGEVQLYAATTIEGAPNFVSLRDGRIRLRMKKDRYDNSESPVAVLDKKEISVYRVGKESDEFKTDGLVKDLKGSADPATEAQAKTDAEADIQSQAAQVQSACGVKLAVKVSWAAYAKLNDYAESRGRTAADLVRLASGHVGQFTNELRTLCADKDYKAAIAKLTEISFTPEKSGGDLPFVVKKNGGKIEITTDATQFARRYDVSEKLSAVF